jgi:hypothetical protein
MSASAFAALSLGGEPLSPMATTQEDQASPLLDLLGKLPDLFDEEVLRRLDPADRAFFAQVSHGCRAAVVASDLPCAGTRVGMPQLSPVDRAELAGAVRALNTDQDYGLAPSLGYVSSTDVPRAVGVVRLELKEFCTSATRLAWAKASGCQWDRGTCALAAQGGHLEVLKWAREHGCPLGTLTCDYAAELGQLEVLKWLRGLGCPWDRVTCRTAARGGHLAVLQWAREHGCPWNARTCHSAAVGGHLEVLKWAREHGCEWDWMTCNAAATSGHVEVLEWARGQDPPCPWEASTCVSAARCGHLSVLQWAREHGYEVDVARVRDRAAAGGHVEILRWLDETGERGGMPHPEHWSSQRSLLPDSQSIRLNDIEGTTCTQHDHLSNCQMIMNGAGVATDDAVWP